MTDVSTAAAPPADAGWIQGVLLAVIPAMAVTNVIAMIPTIPKLLVVFGSIPGVSVLVPMAVTAPTLAVGLSGIGFGVLGERIGRRRLLEISTALFAVTAILPFWLTSLPWILVARVATGVALGAMTTSGVGLTGDYFSGDVRRRWLAIQGGAGSGAGVVASVIAGALGDINWRLPFLLLAVGFLLLAALLLLPTRHATGPVGQHHEEELEQGAGAQAPWLTIAVIFALGVFGSLIIFPPAFEMGLVFQEKNLGAATLTGFATAILSAGAVAGAVGAGMFGRLSAPWKMAVAFAVSGVGTLLVSNSGQIPPIMVGAAAIGVGQGMIGPVLSIWMLDRTPALARGRIVGLFSTAFYLALFAAPLLSAWVASKSASVSSSMICYEAASLIAIVVIAAFSIRRRRPLTGAPVF
jgi:MFS family permease